jgi:hypothetical protein
MYIGGDPSPPRRRLSPNKEERVAPRSKGERERWMGESGWLEWLGWRVDASFAERRSCLSMWLHTFMTTFVRRWSVQGSESFVSVYTKHLFTSLVFPSPRGWDERVFGVHSIFSNISNIISQQYSTMVGVFHLSKSKRNYGNFPGFGTIPSHPLPLFMRGSHHGIFITHQRLLLSLFFI